MDTIKNYLENIFQGFPDTPEVHRAKDDLFTMMEDKYYELKNDGKTENEAIGIVISEFGNIDELTEELGLNSHQTEPAMKQEGRLLSLNEINDYMNTSRKTSVMIGIGVMLCIFSVIPLLLFDVLPIVGELSDVIGFIFLFVMIAIAVAIFILSGMISQKYESLKKEFLQLDPSTEMHLKSEKDLYQRPFTIQIIIGVCLCILSVIPVIVIGSLSDENALLDNCSVITLLVFVGIAVYLFITAGMKMDCYKVLLQEDEYKKEIKEIKQNELTALIASIYWPIITCIYLGYSFITGNWGMSWIIWPITGILFGAIACICNAVEQARAKRMK